jgi:CTP:molybdopterin cytidylyltransferase MocA
LTAAVVLAAGAGTRFEGPTSKLLARIDGVPVVRRAVDHAVEAGLDMTLVVVGDGDDGEVAAALPAEVRVVRNPDAAGGIATSLQAAITAVESASGLGAGEGACDAVVVGLGDQPFVPAGAWREVAAHTASPIATATFDGRRSPPVRLAREVWALLPTSGDRGASALMDERPDLVAEVPCDGSPDDIDTVEDLTRWS